MASDRNYSTASSCREEGDGEIGRFWVSNVVGSSGDGSDMKKFWSKHSPRRDFSSQKCGYAGCGEPAEVGGHVWVKDHPDELRLCFILPMCESCNDHRDYDYDQWHETKAKVRIVARNSTNNMYIVKRQRRLKYTDRPL